MTYRNTRDLGDGLHFLDTPNADFRNPKGTADMGPFLTGFGGFHGSTPIRTELTFGFNPERARSAMPLTGGNAGDTIAGLMDAYITLITENHFVCILRIGLKSSRKNEMNEARRVIGVMASDHLPIGTHHR